MIKKTGFIIIIIIIIGGVWMFADEVNFQSRQQDTASNNSSGIEVNLEEKAVKDFSPEVAVLNLGVETEKEDLNSAFITNNKKMNEVTENLEELGFVNLETSNFNIHTRRVRQDQGDYKLFYRISHQIKATTEKIDELSQIIKTAVNAGANQVNSIRYQLKNEKEAKKEVTEMALAQLQDKIKYIAENLNKEKTKLKSLNINENYIEGRNNMSLDAKGMGAESIQVPISPQDIKVQIRVQGTFQIN